MNIRAIVVLLGVVWCAVMHQASAAGPMGANPRVCRLPLETGLCRARIPRYGYDQAYQNCVRFIYGGCRGNANNFETLAECERVCGASNF